MPTNKKQKKDCSICGFPLGPAHPCLDTPTLRKVEEFSQKLNEAQKRWGNKEKFSYLPALLTLLLLGGIIMWTLMK